LAQSCGYYQAEGFYVPTYNNASKDVADIIAKKRKVVVAAVFQRLQFSSGLGVTDYTIG
jgi:hypothetical protein